MRHRAGIGERRFNLKYRPFLYGEIAIFRIRYSVP